MTYNDINREVHEFNVPYRLKDSEKVKELIVKLESTGISPYEYCHYVYRYWGPDKLVEGIVCSDKAWEEFQAFRNIRIGENRIKTELEKKRLRYLLQSGQSVKEIISSNLETFFTLFKYILASIEGLEDKEKYNEGAIYELRSMPELRQYFDEFGERYFPEYKEVAHE